MNNKPVAYRWKSDLGYIYDIYDYGNGEPLYTTPHHASDVKQTKPLSFEDVEDCFPENGCSSTEDGFGLVVSAQFLHEFARAILRKASEK